MTPTQEGKYFRITSEVLPNEVIARGLGLLIAPPGGQKYFPGK
jgi:hypothetical protein